MLEDELLRNRYINILDFFWYNCVSKLADQGGNGYFQKKKGPIWGEVQLNATSINGVVIIHLWLTMFLSHDEVTRLT